MLKVPYAMGGIGDMSCNPSSYCLMHAACKRVKDATVQQNCVPSECAGMKARGWCASMYQGCIVLGVRALKIQGTSSDLNASP